MANFQDNCEIDCMDKLLIDCVREYPTLYYTDNYTESDERNWDIIQKKTGIQSMYFILLILNRSTKGMKI